MSEHYDMYCKEFEHGKGLNALIRRLKEKQTLANDRIKELEQLLKHAKCPDARCTNGSIPQQVAPYEWEAQQCQWCFERKQALNPQKGD